jgi:peroxiredoxin
LSRVQFSRAYRLDARVFVLDAASGGSSVAFLTTLRARDPNPHITSPSISDNAPSSVHLERARVLATGKVVAPAAVTLVPLQSVPTIECGVFVETPPGRVVVGQTWEVAEEGRPVHSWKVEGVEMVNGASCVKLVGTQQTDDWEHGRADHAAWRRIDTVWIAPRTGVANRVERVIERREPAHTRATYQSVLRYDLESNLQYGSHYDDRAADIQEARAFADSAATLAADPVRNATQLRALLGKIDFYIERNPSHSPYREAVLQVKRFIQTACKGEAPPAAPVEESSDYGVVSVGAMAPDGLLPNYSLGGSAQLKSWIGRPIVILFYSPKVPSSSDLLLFAQRLADTYPRGLTVLGLAVSSNAAEVLTQRDRLHLTFPLLDGSGLLRTYGVTATPRIVVLDAAGIVHTAILGWGEETAAEIQAEVQRCIK